MEVETNSTEDASTVRAASTESIKNIVSVEINFPQKNGNDVNSKYALAEEETRKADSDKTGEISETRPYGIFQESGKACEESGKQMGYQACDDSYSKESKIFRKTDSEALVMETLPKSSELEDESTSISSKLAINQGENVEKSFEKETCSEEELRAIDNNQSSRPQNEHGQSSKPLEAYDITQCESKESGENEQSDYQSVAPGMENVIAKHSSSEEKLTMESRINTNNDVEAQEKTTESYSSSEIKDGEKIMPEKAMDLKGATEAELQKPETESVPEDKALSVLPTTTSITLKGVGESIQGDIHKEEEASPLTDTREEHRPEKDFEKNTVLEKFDLNEAISNTSIEDEKKIQNQSEAQSVEIVAVMHPNLGGLENRDINPINNTEELEKDPASLTRQKLVIIDGGNIKQEEEKVMELREKATDMQLEKSATGSIPVDGPKEEDSTTIENKSSGPENAREKRTRVLQAIENPKPMTKIEADTKENANNQSEASNMENVIIKQINIEGKETAKSSTTLSHETDELQKYPEPHPNNAKIKEFGKITLEESIDIEAADMEIQKSATASVPKDEALSTLHTRESTGVERVEESIQEEIQTEDKIPGDEAQTELPILEIFKGETIGEIIEQQTVQFLQEEESAVTDDYEFCRPKTELEKTTKIVEAIDQPEAITKVGAENEARGVHQSKASSMESVITEHITAEGMVKSESRTKSNYEVDKLKKTPASHLEENSEIMPGIIEDESSQTLPNIAPVRVEVVDENMQLEIHVDVELAVTDAKEGQTPENEFEQKVEVLKEFDLHEVTHQTSEYNELKVESQSEALNQDTVFMKHVNLEGETTTPSNDTEEQENIPVTHRREKFEINNEKFTQVEAKEMEEVNIMQLHALQSVPEDKALQTLSITAYVGTEAFDKSIQDEIHTEELEVTTTKEEQAYGLQVTHQTSAENVLKAEPQTEVQTQETTNMKYPNLEGDITKINPTNDPGEKEKLPVYNTGKKLENEDNEKFIREDAEDTEEATIMQLLETSIESPAEDEVQSTVSISANVKGVPEDKVQQTLHKAEFAGHETVDEQSEEIQKKAELVVPRYIAEQTEENDFDTKKENTETSSVHKVTCQPNKENEQKVECQPETHNQETTFVKHLNPDGETVVISLITDTEEQEMVSVFHHQDNLGIEDDAIFIQDETKGTKMQPQEIPTESVPEDKSQQTLPKAESASNKTIDEHNEDEREAEFAVTPVRSIEEQIEDHDFDTIKENSKATELHEGACQPEKQNEQRVECQPEMLNQETTFVKHLNADGETVEISSVSDPEEQEMVLESQPQDKLGIEDGAKFIQDETKGVEEGTKMQPLEIATESVPEDKSQQTLPKPESAGNKTVDEHNEDETHREAEFTVTLVRSIKEHIEDQDFDTRKENSEATELHEGTCQPKTENEQKVECQPEMHNQETTYVKHLNADGETTEISPVSDTEEQEMVSESHPQEKLGIEDHAIFIQDEMRRVEGTNMQSLEIATESVPEDKSHETLPKAESAGNKMVNEHNVHETQREAEFAVTLVHSKEDQIEDQDFDTKTENSEANELHGGTSQPETENEQKVKYQPETHNQETTYLKHLNADGETTEINPFSDTAEQEMVSESHPQEKLGIVDDARSTQEETKGVEEETNLQSLGIATERVPEDKSQQTLPKAESARNKTVDQHNEYEAQREPEFAVTLVRSIEEQIEDQDFDTEKEKSEEYELHEGTYQPKKEIKQKVECQPETHNHETTFVKHLNADAETTEISPVSDPEEQEMVSKSQPQDKLGIEDDAIFIQEETKGVEGTKMQSLEIATESVPEDKAQQTLPKAEYAGNKTVDEHNEDETQRETEFAVTVVDSRVEQIDDHDFETKKENSKATELHEGTCQPKTENEQKVECQPETHNQETTYVKHLNADGETTEISPISDTEEQEIVLESQHQEKLGIEDGAISIQDETKGVEEGKKMQPLAIATESVPEDKSQQTLPKAESAGNKTVDVHNEDQTHREADFTVTPVCSIEEQIENHDFDTKKENSKASELHEGTCQPKTENEQKVEWQPEMHNQETTFVKHLNIDGETTEITPISDTEEQEIFSESHPQAKLEIEDLAISIQGKTEGVEEGTKMQPLEIATEMIGVPEVKAQQTLPMAEFTSKETVEKHNEEEIQREAEFVVTHSVEEQIEEHDFDMKKENIEASEFREVTCQPKNENELKDECQPETHNQETTFVVHLNAYGETKEINRICDTYEQEMVSVSFAQEKLGIEDDGIFIQEDAKGVEEATEMQSLEIATESFAEDKAQETLSKAESAGKETVHEHNEGETQREAQFAVKSSIEEQIEEHDFNTKKENSEASELHGVTCQPSKENEQKAKCQLETHSQETTFVKHLNADGEATKINPISDTEGQEMVSVSLAQVKLGIEDDSIFIQEDAKGVEEVSKMQSLEIATESLPGDEFQSALPTSTIIEGDSRQIIQQTFNNDESTVIDKEKTRCIQENEVERLSNVVQSSDQPETMANVNEVKEHQADHQSEVSNMQTEITNYINAEGIVTTERGKKPTHNADEQESSVHSHCMDGNKVTAEEATDTEQLTDVEIQKSETERTCQLNAKNELKAESQLVKLNQATTLKKKLKSDGETTEINPTNDNKEQKLVSLCHIEEKIGITEDGILIQVEAKVVEEATNIQQVETATKRLPEDDFQSTLPTSAIIKEGIVTSESCTKSTYSAVEHKKSINSHTIENLESRDGNEITAEEATNTEQLTDMEIRKSETGGLTENEVQSTLPTSAIVEEGINALESSTKSSHNADEQSVSSNLVKNLESKNGGKITAEATDTEQLTDVEIQKSETKSAPEDKAVQTLPNAGSASKNAVDEIKEEIQRESEIAVIHIKEGHIPKYDFEVKKDNTEASGSRDVPHQLRAENEQNTEFQAELQKQETTFIENLNSDGKTTQLKTTNDTEEQEMVSVSHTGDKLGIEDDVTEEATKMQSLETATAKDIVTLEHSTNSGHDEDEQGKSVKSCSIENLEREDKSEITTEEATDSEQLTNVEIQKSGTESVLEDKALEASPSAASVSNKAVDKSNQEEIQREVEFSVTHAKEGQIPEYGFDARKDNTEACGLHEVTYKLSMENKLQPETHNQDTEINTTNDTEQQEMVLMSHPEEKLGIEYDKKLIQEEEVKGVEEAAKVQPLESATKSLPGSVFHSKFPTSTIGIGDTDETLQQQTFQEVKSAAIENDKSFREEIALKKPSNVNEIIDQLEIKTMDKVAEENEEPDHHQSEASSMEGVITKYINTEGTLTSVSNTKSSYDVHKVERIVQSQLVENFDSRVGCKITTGEATDTRQLTDVEIQKSETESVLEDKAIQILPNIASFSIEEFDRSIQEIHTEAELAVSENDFEAKKKVSQDMLKQAFDLQKVTCQTNIEIEEKVEPLSDRKYQTIVLKHPNLEGETIEIEPINNTEEHEKVSASHSGERLEINADVTFMQEESNEMQKAIERKLHNTTTESIQEDEAQSTLPTSTIVKAEKVEGIFQEQTLKEVESRAIDDNNSGKPENGLEQTANIFEKIDQPKTITEVSVENDEQADHQSEQSSMENVITKHLSSKGMSTTANRTKSSYDVEELKKVLESNSTDNSRIKDGVNIMLDESSDMKEATYTKLQKPEIESVPEDKATLTLSIMPSVRVEINEESIQEEIQKEAESAVNDTKEEQKAENDFVENTKVIEGFDLHKAPCNTCTENVKHAEVQSEVQSQETMIITHPKLKELDNAEISPSDDTKELEKQHEVAKPGGVSESASADSRTKEKRTNIQDQIPKPNDHIQENFQFENQTKFDPQMKVEHHLSIPQQAEPTSVAILITKEAPDEVDIHGKSENTEEQAIDSKKKSIPRVQKLLPKEDTVNQVKDHNTKTFKATYSNDLQEITESSFEHALAEKEAASIDSNEAADQAATGKQETREIESTQLGGAKEDEEGDEFEKISEASSGIVILEDSRDADVKISHKKSHGILSGVGSKVKHSISKVKKAITGKSSHPKTPSPK
ncbi:hypothetical protein RJT34_16287 [Clitoria ternatea]|uniref:Uncharacterized protein n=1 Tax=Clitoria ternatea TaxID=43366 RepID=A0AAN9J765_CLITE